jgi:aldehyde:ferredoxin oxidoreductase
MDRASFQGMLSEYYELRGWDVEKGIPLKATLERLGLMNGPHDD